MYIDKSFQIDEVMTEGYRPSTEDILRTRIVTSGIFEINFTIGVSTFLNNCPWTKKLCTGQKYFGCQ